MSFSVTEAIAYINRHMGYRTGGDANIIIELNSAKQALEDDERLPEPWFLEKEGTLATILSTHEVAQPSDFVKEAEDTGGLFRYLVTDTDDPYKELVKQDIGFLRQAKTGTGTPTHYAIWGTDFHLFPLPDAVYPLRLFYKYKAADYAAGQAARDWLAEAPLLIIGRAGFLYANGIRDEGAMKFFTAIESDARLRYEAKAFEIEYSEHRLVMGGEN